MSLGKGWLVVSGEAQRMSKSADWGTPDEVIEVVRCLLGEIDLDPCSSEKHNRRVKANHFFTAGGLDEDWNKYTSVFCNPPGSPRGVHGWWEKWRSYLGPKIWLGFNMNQLAYLTPTPLREDWIYLPKKRFKYVGAGNNPPHNSYLVGSLCAPTYNLYKIKGTCVILNDRS